MSLTTVSLAKSLVTQNFTTTNLPCSTDEKETRQVLEMYSGKIRVVFASLNDAAAALQVSPTNLATIIKKKKKLGLFKYKYGPEDTIYDNALVCERKSNTFEATSDASRIRQKYRNAISQPQYRNEGDKKKRLQKKINFDTRNKFKMLCRTFSKKTSSFFVGPKKEEEDESIRLYLVMSSGLNPNNRGTTSNDTELKRKKPQVLFTPVTSNGSMDHMNNILLALHNKSFEQKYNVDWTDDTDELVDSMAFGDKHYEALLGQDDEDEDKDVEDDEDDDDDEEGDDEDKDVEDDEDDDDDEKEGDDDDEEEGDDVEDNEEGDDENDDDEN